MLVARALGKRVVLNYRSDEAPDVLQRSAIARNTIRRVDKNIVPSRLMVDVFREFGIDASIVPNILDLERFRFRERDPLRPRLLSTRNFDALDNVATTIRAFTIVQDRWPDASLTLVGGGAQEADLRALVAQLALRNVTFAGRATSAAIADCYADNDIYIQSPNIDNLPTSVLEAFARGMPVVSTEAGGVPAILTHNVHGLLAPLAGYQTLGHHVLRLLARPDYARAPRSRRVRPPRGSGSASSGSARIAACCSRRDAHTDGWTTPRHSAGPHDPPHPRAQARCGSSKGWATIAP
jgi:glycosyltransferase involved in cell wall biosynthesis